MSSTAIAATGPSAEVQQYLRQRIAELATACPTHLTPERLIQVACICVYRTPKIAQCDKASILAAIVEAGSLGLDLSPNRGEGYLIPRWNKNAGALECQFQPGYRGLAKLVRNSGAPFIQSRLVHAKDKFRYWHEDDVLHLIHEPCIEAAPGIVAHVYCLVKLAGGDRLIEVMTRADVEDIRRRSERPDSGPWAEQWGEMAKKTVLKRLCKSLDQSPELARAIEVDNREYERDDDTRPAIADNGSGHGSGKYAPEEQAEAYIAKMGEYVNKRNAAWIDRWQDDQTGEVPAGVKDLCNIWQADGHLAKWAVQTGRLAEGSLPDDGKIKNRQIGRLTAIVYHRSKGDRIALADELARYIDEQERRQAEKLRREHPALFGDADEGPPSLAGDADEAQGMADEDPAE